MTELEKCNAGLPYSFADHEMIARKSEAIRQCELYNAIDGKDYEAQYRHLKQMLGAVGERVWIAKTFGCDCGKNILDIVLAEQSCFKRNLLTVVDHGEAASVSVIGDIDSPVIRILVIDAVSHGFGEIPRSSAQIKRCPVTSRRRCLFKLAAELRYIVLVKLFDSSEKILRSIWAQRRINCKRNPNDHSRPDAFPCQIKGPLFSLNTQIDLLTDTHIIQ